MDIRHDRAQTLVNFFRCPLQAHGVLRHFQATGSHATGIACLARAVQDLCALEDCDGFRRTGHISALGYTEATVIDKRLRIGFLYLVLRCTRHCYIARDTPRTFTGEVLCLRILLRVLFDSTATNVLQFEYIIHLLFIQSLGIIDEPVGVAERKDFCSEPHGFLCSELRNVTRTGYAHTLAIKRLATRTQHSLGKITCTVAGSLRAHQAATPLLTFAGKRTGELVTQTFVLPEHVSDFASAYTYISCRHIGVSTYMALQFSHERLAEPHHLGITLATRREIRTAFGATHRQRGQRILEGLLESQELHD